LPAEYPTATLRSAFINRARREGMRYFKQSAVLIWIIVLLMAAGVALNDEATEPSTTEPTPVGVRQWTSPTPELTSIPDKEPKIRYYDIPLADELQEYTFILCAENNLNYEMVLAVMEWESDYREKVISKTNDYGLMQINRINHEWLQEELGINDFLDAEQNIRAGVHILAGLSEKYDDPHKVLMAYKFGEAGAKKSWAEGATSCQYSKAVMARRAEFLGEEGMR